MLLAIDPQFPIDVPLDIRRSHGLHWHRQLFDIAEKSTGDADVVHDRRWFAMCFGEFLLKPFQLLLGLAYWWPLPLYPSKESLDRRHEVPMPSACVFWLVPVPLFISPQTYTQIPIDIRGAYNIDRNRSL